MPPLPCPPGRKVASKVPGLSCPSLTTHRLAGSIHWVSWREMSRRLVGRCPPSRMCQPSAVCLQALSVTSVSRARERASDAREQYDAVVRSSLQQQLPEQDRTRVSASPHSKGNPRIKQLC